VTHCSDKIGGGCRCGAWAIAIVWSIAAIARAQEAAPADHASDAAVVPLETDAGASELLLTQMSGASAEETDESTLKLYGFMDFGIDKWFASTTGVGLLRPTNATTFVFGNLNLYFEATPIGDLRTMVELRFTLAPHGEETQLGPPLGTSYERIDTTAFDFSSPSSQAQLRLGGLFIERAWGEYPFLDQLKVQWGVFLNPFGIWNLDHGSPTLISLMLPTFIAAQIIPTRLLGVHVYGSWFVGACELSYALHVSNGRTPLDFDLTEDKALGGRVYVAHEGDYGRLVLGASGYFGTYVDKQKKIDPAGATSLASDNLFTWVETLNYSEYILGIDVALDLGALRLRSEGVFRWVNYNHSADEQFITADGSIQYLPSRLEWSAYVLGAYRTPWRIEPYLEVELASKSFSLPRWAAPTRATSADYATVFTSFGFNLRLTTHALVKTQLVWIRSYDGHFGHKGVDFPVIFARIVQSF
jgi:hypothetical protein